MSFRTIEITGPAELHVKSGSLVIEKENKDKTEQADHTSNCSGDRKKSLKDRKRKKPENRKLIIPLEDISTIVCMGAGVRISTMAMAQLCRNKISMTMLDEKYRTSGFLNAYEANARQSLTMRRQVFLKTERAEKLWREIVSMKIQNQARVIDILGLADAEKVRSFAQQTDNVSEIDPLEAGAAKAYFAQLCPEMNRREETPMNSRLNYGYAILRNSIIRAVVSAGLLPSFGIHHQNLYNAYNLADDLIEPYRPSVDLIAYGMTGETDQLSRDERKQLASVVLFAVEHNGQKVSILQSIDRVVGEYRAFVMEECNRIDLPHILPAEIILQIKE
ncbi:MAG: type II CRISPR-associated endonuclease Cas1 [Oscillospiraceae bacterium]|nr:type II CRISPR-associated endonuclease Cas1 [Oscillospiraceae bacterium]